MKEVKGNHRNLLANLALAAVVFVGSVAGVSTAYAGSAVMAGSKAPKLEGKDVVSGKPFNWDATLKNNKVLIIDFWASWCKPCKKELPFLSKLYGKLKSKGLAVVAVNIDKQASNMSGFLDEVKKKGAQVRFPVIHDPKQSIPPRYEPPTMPTSYIVDSTGKVCKRHAGFTPGKEDKEIIADVKKMLKTGRCP